MPRQSLKPDIVSAGLRVMFRKGFNGAGIRDVVAEASAPQGCFTNHFRSKEAFAGEVLDLYFAHVQELVSEALDDVSLTPRDRLLRYLDLITDRLAADQFTRGCLIGDFSLEVVQESADLRQKLQTIYRAWHEPFAACIAEAQRQGQVAATFPPDELAEFLIASWEGAILRMKVERTAEPLERFKRIAFATAFKEDHPR